MVAPTLAGVARVHCWSGGSDQPRVDDRSPFLGLRRFQNFPKILQGYINKMPSDHPGVTTRTTKGGKVVPHLVPVLDPEYKPPALSPLGRKLLGLDDWSAQ